MADFAEIRPHARSPVLSTLIYGLLAAIALARAGVPRKRSDLKARQQSAPSFEQPRGRGRRATTPWQIPWSGWKDIFWRTYQQSDEDRLLATAAGVAFFGLLAAFPAMAAVVSLYGFFADPQSIAKHLNVMSGIVPSGVIDVATEQLTRIAQKGGTKLSLAFVVATALAIWGANSGMKAILDGLNVVYEEREKRGFVKLNLIALALTLGAILALLCAVALVVVLPAVLTQIGLSSIADTLLALLRWPALFLMTVVGLAVLYRFGPSREHAQWQWLSVGAVLGSLVWLVSSILFSWYVEHFGTYNATYGSLGAVAGMMMWMWISAVVILAAAELNAEIEHQTARDTTTEAPKPIGTRGAKMADTIGKSSDKSGGAGICRNGT